MAADAVGNVSNAFVSVFLDHLALVVAVEAGVAAVIVVGMAGRAVAVSAAMVQREAVAEGSIAPIGCVGVAGATGAGEMVGWRRMAGAAILRAN